jgi:hypothetical protein
MVLPKTGHTVSDAAHASVVDEEVTLHVGVSMSSRVGVSTQVAA